VSSQRWVVVGRRNKLFEDVIKLTLRSWSTQRREGKVWGYDG
jgi:hypothetical protein